MEPTGPKLLDRVREAIRMRHYSRRTEEAYVQWIRRFILFHHKTHPANMRAPEISAFLGWLAVQQAVAPSTQNQALSAILFLYRESCMWTPVRSSMSLELLHPFASRSC